MALPLGSQVYRILGEIQVYQEESFAKGTADPENRSALIARVEQTYRQVAHSGRCQALLRRLDSARTSLIRVSFATHAHLNLREFIMAAKRECEGFDHDLLSASRVDELYQYCEHFMTLLRTAEFAITRFRMSGNTASELSVLYRQMEACRSALEIGLSQLRNQVPPPSGLMGLFVSHPIDRIQQLLNPGVLMPELNLVSDTLKRWPYKGLRAENAFPQLGWIDQTAPVSTIGVDEKSPSIPFELSYIYTVAHLFSTERGKDPQFALEIHGSGWRTVGKEAWEKLPEGADKETIRTLANIDFLTAQLNQAVRGQNDQQIRPILALLSQIYDPKISQDFTVGDFLQELLLDQLHKNDLDFNPTLRGAGFTSGPFGSIPLTIRLEAIGELRRILHRTFPFPLDLIDFKPARL